MASQPKFEGLPSQMLFDGFPAKVERTSQPKCCLMASQPKFKGLPSPNVVWWLPSHSWKGFPAQMLFDGFPAKVERASQPKGCLMASQPKLKGLPSPNVVWWLPSQGFKDFPGTWATKPLWDGAQTLDSPASVDRKCRHHLTWTHQCLAPLFFHMWHGDTHHSHHMPCSKRQHPFGNYTSTRVSDMDQTYEVDDQWVVFRWKWPVTWSQPHLRENTAFKGMAGAIESTMDWWRWNWGCPISGCPAWSCQGNGAMDAWVQNRLAAKSWGRLTSDMPARVVEEEQVQNVYV